MPGLSWDTDAAEVDCEFGFRRSWGPPRNSIGDIFLSFTFGRRWHKSISRRIRATVGMTKMQFIEQHTHFKMCALDKKTMWQRYWQYPKLLCVTCVFVMILLLTIMIHLANPHKMFLYSCLIMLYWTSSHVAYKQPASRGFKHRTIVLEDLYSLHYRLQGFL